MKKFVIHTSLLLAFVLLVNFLFYGFIQYPRKDYYNFSGKVPAGHKFIFGDSHAKSIIANLPENAFNFYNAGYSSDNYVDVQRKIEWLMDKGRLQSGDTVFLQFDHHMFFPYRENSNNNDLTEYLPTHEITRRLPIVFFKNLFTPLVISNTIKQRGKDRDAPVRKCFTENAKALARMRKRVVTQYDYKAYSESLKKTFVDIIRSMQNRHVTVVLLSYPLHPTYYNLLHSDYDVSLFSGFRAALHTEFPTMLMLDYEKWTLEGCYFKDEDHLNANGSIELTRLIKHDLVKAQGFKDTAVKN